jgi:hypothetical protein
MPIPKHELRIGNHIFGAAIYELHTEFAILQTSNRMRPEYPYEDLMPLPITEDYLIDSGFTKFDLSWQETGYHLPGLVLVKDGDVYHMVQSGQRVSRGISTINHLENLYYALTEIELPDDTGDRDEITRNGFRIGNRVGQGIVLELHSTHALVWHYIGPNYPIEYGSLEPIMIRTEDLPKMGFIPRGQKWERGNFYLLAEHDRIFLRTDLDGYISSPITSLHQLQNLFFDLTGAILPVGVL